MIRKTAQAWPRRWLRGSSPSCSKPILHSNPRRSSSCCATRPNGGEARANLRLTRTGTKNGVGASSMHLVRLIWCSSARARTWTVVPSSHRHLSETGMETTSTSPRIKTGACSLRVTVYGSKAAWKTRTTEPTRKSRSVWSSTGADPAIPWNCLIGVKRVVNPLRGTST